MHGPQPPGSPAVHRWAWRSKGGLGPFPPSFRPAARATRPQPAVSGPAWDSTDNSTIIASWDNVGFRSFCKFLHYLIFWAMLWATHYNLVLMLSLFLKSSLTLVEIS